MPNDDSSHVALLIDFENLVLAFKGRRGYPAGSLSLVPIVEFLEENFGDVILRRSYADWSHRDFNVYQRQCQDLGIEMIHVRRRTRASKKNGADILLTADAVESLLLRPFVSVYAVVSGDSDIGPLVTKLKSHGKTVVVIGPDSRSTASHVIELADRFKFYTDIAPHGRTARRPSKRRQAGPEDVVIALLRAEGGGGIESADLKRRLLATKGFEDFNQKALGFRNWTAFLEAIPQVQVERRSDLGIDVSLRGD